MASIAVLCPPVSCVRRRWVSVVLVVLLAGLLTVMADPRPVQAQTSPIDIIGKVPRSIVVQRAAASAVPMVACTASVVCGTLVVAGTVACLVYCDEVGEWLGNKIETQSKPPGGCDLTPNWAPTSATTTAQPYIGMPGGNAKPTYNMAGAPYPTSCTGSVYISESWKCQNDAGSVMTGMPRNRNEWQRGNWDTLLNVSICNGDPAFGLRDFVLRIEYGAVVNVYTLQDIGAAAGNAEVTSYTSTVTCKAPDGSTGTGTVTGPSATIAAPDCSVILPGSYRERVVVTRTSGGVTSTIGEAVNDLSQHPLCADNSCRLGWSTPTSSTSSVCKWGGYTMPDGDCLQYAPVKPEYDPSTQPSPGPSPGPSPSPTFAPGPATPDYDPVPNGTGTSTTTNPDGSTTTTTSRTNPDGTTTTTRTTTNPDGTTRSSSTTTTGVPRAGVNPGAGTEAEGSQGCLGQNWSWNPVSWVFAPVKCALAWAFVPSPQTMENMKNAAGLSDKVPFSYFSQAGGWLSSAFSPPAGACLDLAANVGPFGRVQMLDSCTPGPVEDILMGYRSLLSIVLYVALIAPLLWWAWRVYAPATTSNA